MNGEEGIQREREERGKGWQAEKRRQAEKRAEELEFNLQNSNVHATSCSFY